MEAKLERYKMVFGKYVPPEFSEMLSNILLNSNVNFKIVKGRKTKLGDFRVFGQEQPVITVNSDLNPYAFLITTLHEFAHYSTYLKYGHKVQPHGVEWKANFQSHLLPILNHPKLPTDIKTALNQSFLNIKASSCSDINLSRILKKYDRDTESAISLELLPKNSKFALGNKVLVRGDKRRTRFECKEVSTGKLYLVHILAQVIQMT